MTLSAPRPHKRNVRRTRMKLISLSSLILALIFINNSVSGDQIQQWEPKQGVCPAGVHKQSNGSFAVVLFCESALGVYLSVMYLDPITSPITPNGKWSLNDRYWHNPLWGSDVTGFRWSRDGKKLYVSTGNIYGSGGYFVLNLMDRRFTQELPKDRAISLDNVGPGYDINGKALDE